MKFVHFLDKEKFSGLILFFLGVWIWWYSGQFPKLEQGYPGPALFPRIISIGLAFCGVVMLFTKGDEKQYHAEARPKDWPRLLLAIVLICIYPFLQPLTGFFPALTAICLGMGILLKVKIWVAVTTAGITAGLLQFLFSNLLGVAL